MKKWVYTLSILTATTSPFLAYAEESLESLSLAQSTPTKQGVNSQFKARDYSYLIGIQGFTEEALQMHFKLYQGYVTNTNLILDILAQYLNEGKERTPQYAELKRRLMWEYDGMRLHEDYFGNLGGKGTKLDMQDPLYKRIVQDFGSYDRWKTDFIATGAMRGIGWAVLYLDPVSGKLTNAWINEHDRGHLAGGDPILIMDVFEHAYMPDYGLDRMKYIDAFFNNIDWNVVASRYPQQNKRIQANGQSR